MTSDRAASGAPPARAGEASGVSAGRNLQLALQPAWEAPGEGRTPAGLLSPDPRVRTLLRVLLSYPDARFVLPDRVNLAAGVDPRLVDTLTRFLERQRWLVRGVTAG
jgi:hypothetical protein